jgi:hypothetical protein
MSNLGASPVLADDGRRGPLLAAAVLAVAAVFVARGG